MKKATVILTVAALIMVLMLSACSVEESATFSPPELRTHVGSWSFEVGEAEDELWRIDATLCEDGTCSIVWQEIEGSRETNERYDGNYRIAEDVSQLPEDMIEDIARNPEAVADCAFYYSSETDRLVATFDTGDYLTFTRTDDTADKSTFNFVGIWDAQQQLEMFLSGSFESEWKQSKPIENNSYIGKCIFEIPNRHSNTPYVYYTILREDNTCTVAVCEPGKYNCVRALIDTKYQLYKTIDEYSGPGATYALQENSVFPIVYNEETGKVYTVDFIYNADEGFGYPQTIPASLPKGE